MRRGYIRAGGVYSKEQSGGQRVYFPPAAYTLDHGKRQGGYISAPAVYTPSRRNGEKRIFPHRRCIPLSRGNDKRGIFSHQRNIPLSEKKIGRVYIVFTAYTHINIFRVERITLFPPEGRNMILKQNPDRNKDVRAPLGGPLSGRRPAFIRQCPVFFADPRGWTYLTEDWASLHIKNSGDAFRASSGGYL